MTYYDYTVVPAPRRVKKIKGIGGGSELFAHALTEAINAMARQGWQYLRSETMAAEETRGLFRRTVAAQHTVLVFCRPRESTDYRRIAGESDAAKAGGRGRGADTNSGPQVTARDERAVLERLQGGVLRPEPKAVTARPGLQAVRTDPEEPTPLRPTPRLGPAENR
jgi:hypothetical protein